MSSERHDFVDIMASGNSRHVMMSIKSKMVFVQIIECRKKNFQYVFSRDLFAYT